METGRAEVGVAILGLGNVGAAALGLLEKNAASIAARVGAPVKVKKVLVRDTSKARAAPVAANYDEILKDRSIDIVVELVGGVDHPRSMITRALDAGKSVVTANKALLAAHGEELFSAAAKVGEDLRFEAAVCGGIPIIRTLREALTGDQVTGLFGIVNGTTNFILTAMAEEGRSYEDALKDAQRLGYAEADPTLDVTGADAAQKLQLLAMLAFGARLSPGSVFFEGITQLQPIDFQLAKEFGQAIKLLAVAKKSDGQLELRVHPVFVPLVNPLAKVRGAFNAVMVHGEALGSALLLGRGAGGLPTASAVVGDIVDLARDRVLGIKNRVPLPCGNALQSMVVRPLAERVGQYYLRFNVADTPGVLGKIATVLGEKGVSLASVQQRPPAPNESVARIMVLTHDAREAAVVDAVKAIDLLTTTRDRTCLVRLEAP